MIKNKIKKNFLCLISVLALTINLLPSQAASSTTPTLAYPSNYMEVVAYTDYQVIWSAPTGNVDHYLFSLRCIKEKDQPRDHSIFNRKTIPANQTNFLIDQDYMLPNRLFRVAVAAVINGKEYWTEHLFFVSIHDMQNKRPVSFKIWSGFETATKNAIYYATLPWNNAVGFEVVNTYAFSNSFPTNTLNQNDGINSIIKVTDIDHPNANMVTRTKIPSNGTTPTEVDILINPAKNWANSKKVGAYDVQSVMTHEMGHAVGLTDKYESFSTTWTMYGNGSTNDISPRSLESYDKIHARAICNAIPV